MQTLAFLLCLMDCKAIKNALIVCPVPIVNATWKKEVKNLLHHFGKDCPIIVDLVTSNMPEKIRNKTLWKAKNWYVITKRRSGVLVVILTSTNALHPPH